MCNTNYCWHIEFCEARRRDIVKLPINSMCLVDMEKTGINRRIVIFRKRGDILTMHTRCIHTVKTDMLEPLNHYMYETMSIYNL